MNRRRRRRDKFDVEKRHNARLLAKPWVNRIRHFEIGSWNIDYVIALRWFTSETPFKFYGWCVSVKFGRGWRAQRARVYQNLARTENRSVRIIDCARMMKPSARNRRSWGKPFFLLL
jgi:hypothetical protein